MSRRRGLAVHLLCLAAVPGPRGLGMGFKPLSRAPHALASTAEQSLAGSPAVTEDVDERYHLDEVAVHDKLDHIVRKHWSCQARWLDHHRVSRHTEAAFGAACEFVCDFHRQRGRTTGPWPVVLDSGCGTGTSTLHLSQLYPDLPVIGVDRSVVRLAKNHVFKPQTHQPPPPHKSDAFRVDARSREVTHVDMAAEGNLLLLRADLVDFWLLVGRAARPDAAEGWQVEHHFVLYPNPCPKPKQIKHRWHGHPVFPSMLMLHAKRMVLRASWKTYLDEFAFAVTELAEAVDSSQGTEAANLARTLARYGPAAKVGPALFSPPPEEPPWTNFEAKYRRACQPTYELVLGDGAAESNAR